MSRMCYQLSKETTQNTSLDWKRNISFPAFSWKKLHHKLLFHSEFLKTMSRSCPSITRYKSAVVDCIIMNYKKKKRSTEKARVAFLPLWIHTRAQEPPKHLQSAPTLPAWVCHEARVVSATCSSLAQFICNTPPGIRMFLSYKEKKVKIQTKSKSAKTNSWISLVRQDLHVIFIREEQIQKTHNLALFFISENKPKKACFLCLIGTCYLCLSWHIDTVANLDQCWLYLNWRFGCSTSANLICFAPQLPCKYGMKVSKEVKQIC